MERSDRRRFLDIFRGRAVDARGCARGIGYACFVWYFVHLCHSLQPMAGIRGKFGRLMCCHLGQSLVAIHSQSATNPKAILMEHVVSFGQPV